MHGQFYWDLVRPTVDKEKSLVWLCSSDIKGETENLITAAQDQAIQHALSSEEQHEAIN
jgi:hypothetical protein